MNRRYKLIRYEDDDATANLKIGPNHFLEVTVPMAATMFCVILFVLMCARWEDSILELETKVMRRFYNHREGPYKDLLLVESDYHLLAHSRGILRDCLKPLYCLQL